MVYKIGGKFKVMFLPYKPMLSLLWVKIRELFFYYSPPNFLALPEKRTYLVK